MEKGTYGKPSDLGKINGRSDSFVATVLRPGVLFSTVKSQIFPGWRKKILSQDRIGPAQLWIYDNEFFGEALLSGR